MPDPDYMVDYDAFQNSFKLTEVNGEEVGVMIMKMAGYYGKYNARMSNALRNYTQVSKDIHSQTDMVTGKPITSSKAEVIAAATPEAAALQDAKVHVQNLEQFINALKALQKGVLLEYSNAV